jgi:DNA ligase-1
MITKPMLAATWEGEPLSFPVYATPKLDGIRALTVDGQLVSRTFKPIRNKSIVEALSDLPDGFDGELVSGNFQQTTHRVMNEDETEGDWQYWIFDYVCDDLRKDYLQRIQDLLSWTKHNGTKNPERILILEPKVINSFEELMAYEKECLDKGFEGLIIRSAKSPYKCGRSTVREGFMLKIKRFSDAEATVVDFVEYEHNTNEAEKDAFGRTKRSDKKEGKVLGNMLGKFILELPDGRRFGCGTGFDMAQRKEIWENKDKYLGRLVKFKYFEVGVKELPRHPVFLGFRHEDDI